MTTLMTSSQSRVIVDVIHLFHGKITLVLNLINLAVHEVFVVEFKLTLFAPNC